MSGRHIVNPLVKSKGDSLHGETPTGSCITLEAVLFLHLIGLWHDPVQHRHINRICY